MPCDTWLRIVAVATVWLQRLRNKWHAANKMPDPSRYNTSLSVFNHTQVHDMWRVLSNGFQAKSKGHCTCTETNKQKRDEKKIRFQVRCLASILYSRFINSGKAVENLSAKLQLFWAAKHNCRHDMQSTNLLKTINLRFYWLLYNTLTS